MMHRLFIKKRPGFDLTSPALSTLIQTQLAINAEVSALI
ncbi:MAG: hypothetical protein FD133_1802, partial [Erysipelotrichaceae bacterium]